MSTTSARLEKLKKGKMQEQITMHLLATHGPVIGADKLWQILSYKSKPAFDRSVQRRGTSLPLFKPEGRDGVFVLAPDLAQYLVDLSETSLIHKTELATTT